MDLEALRAQARAVATRMENRLSAALGANRDLTADEETAQSVDEAELTGLKAKIAAAEASASTEQPADPAAAATAAERARILALADLCPSSVFASPLRKAIESGQEAGAFAIGLAKAAKTRGASMDDLRDSAVSAEQLPEQRASTATTDPSKVKTAAEQSKAILGLAAAANHPGLAHLKRD